MPSHSSKRKSSKSSKRRDEESNAETEAEMSASVSQSEKQSKKSGKGSSKSGKNSKSDKEGEKKSKGRPRSKSDAGDSESKPKKPAETYDFDALTEAHEDAFVPRTTKNGENTVYGYKSRSSWFSKALTAFCSRAIQDIVTVQNGGDVVGKKYPQKYYAYDDDDDAGSSATRKNVGSNPNKSSKAAKEEVAAKDRKPPVSVGTYAGVLCLEIYETFLGELKQFSDGVDILNDDEEVEKTITISKKDKMRALEEKWDGHPNLHVDFPMINYLYKYAEHGYNETDNENLARATAIPGLSKNVFDVDIKPREIAIIDTLPCKIFTRFLRNFALIIAKKCVINKSVGKFDIHDALFMIANFPTSVAINAIERSSPTIYEIMTTAKKPTVRAPRKSSGKGKASDAGSAEESSAEEDDGFN